MSLRTTAQMPRLLTRAEWLSITREVLASYAKDKRTLVTLALSLGGVTALALSRAADSAARGGDGLTDVIRAEARAKKESSKTANSAVSRRSSAKSAKSDATLVARLRTILPIIVPSATSTEACLLYTQTATLICRSLLSLRISELKGRGLKSVLNRSWKEFSTAMVDFFFTSVAASFVNSTLKYLANTISVRFRERLTKHTHARYANAQNLSFYKAAVLRVGDLDNADARICDDLSLFCDTASDLFGRTFKPALDVVLSTHRMGQNMGYTGLAILYSYFALSGVVIKAVSPPFSKYIAHLQKLEGTFRRNHSRLITHAEEVAFLNGADRERKILDDSLLTVTRAQGTYFWMQFKQGIFDQFVTKYFASQVGWPVVAVPFLMSTSNDATEVASKYRESDSLITEASAAVGDLMLVYKKLQRLNGYASRVVELLEAVKKGSDAQDTKVPSTEISEDGAIEFRDLTVYSPDRRLLLDHLNLRIPKGRHLLVTGPNGAGKTSLFRVLRGLWAQTDGQLFVPKEASERGMLYVPQRPYLVTGTLRDQVTYPQHYRKASREVDARVHACLEKVRLTKLCDASATEDPFGLSSYHHDWNDVLSGGEKQRVGFARLLYHSPAYAVLDEATAAINPDEESKLYVMVLENDTTVFSIAHRLELRKFHKAELHFVGDGSGSFEIRELR